MNLNIIAFLIPVGIALFIIYWLKRPIKKEKEEEQEMVEYQSISNLYGIKKGEKYLCFNANNNTYVWEEKPLYGYLYQDREEALESLNLYKKIK